ncbi:hypothetical protein BDY21DRAFT_160045 [Lineolata rhizophorae]|uniref:DUF7514 domain-containing protein n=1 Tax=Lineolata rhizophorae TaxID=578093 RepID=A0A6A6P8Q4_9PEZI|nr:hypothetical protein BDY21DRAFT_160045 [Lineolata rhizophorae]
MRMAYDSYRDRDSRSSPPFNSDSPPYPTSYYDPADPRAYQQSGPYPPPPPPQSSYPPERPRSRGSPREYVEYDSQRQPQPIYDTINNAFDKSSAASHVDPAIIAQITEEVRRKVIESLPNLNATAPPPQHAHYRAQSHPAFGGPVPPREDVYTPPTPEPPPQDPGFYGADPERRRSPNENGMKTERSRPPPVERVQTDGEETTLEKIWQPLFDADGQPTVRLGQFLRGLAIHLIQDYEPKGSLVITPAKMLKFYEDVRLPEEIYPWNALFGKLNNPEISRIYRGLKCQHHLVQSNSTDVPCIPSLTPDGFQTWMTLMIQAHPDMEFQRLAKAVLDMPISNADDCKERFPKELSRRLFPKYENREAKQRCFAAISDSDPHVVKLPRIIDMPPPPPTAPIGSFERDRTPYASPPNPSMSAPPPSSHPPDHAPDLARDRDDEGDDDDESRSKPFGIPLERERKPYTAKEGTGKRYETADDGGPRAASDTTTSPSSYMTGSATSATTGASSSRYEASAGYQQHHRHHRTSSSNAPPQSAYAGPSSSSTKQAHNHPRRSASNAAANGGVRRPRSPTFNPYTRSEPVAVGEPPSGYYGGLGGPGGMGGAPLYEATSGPPDLERGDGAGGGRRVPASEVEAQMRAEWEARRYGGNGGGGEEEYLRRQSGVGVGGGGAGMYAGPGYGVGVPPPPPRY